MLTLRAVRLALAGLIFSILSGPAWAAVTIPDPDAVDAVIDPKREFVGVIMSQLYSVPEGGQGRDAAIRAELYRQFWAEEAN